MVCASRPVQIIQRHQILQAMNYLFEMEYKIGFLLKSGFGGGELISAPGCHAVISSRKN